MRRLGISIYPEHSTVEKDKEYLTLASKYGFYVCSHVYYLWMEKKKLLKNLKKRSHMRMH